MIKSKKNPNQAFSFKTISLEDNHDPNRKP